MRVTEVAPLESAYCTADTDLRDAATMLVENGGNHVVVVDDRTRRRPVGVLDAGEVIKAGLLARGGPARLSAGHCVTSAPLLVDDGIDAKDALVQMKAQAARHVVITDKDGRFLGLASRKTLEAGAA